MRTPRSRNDFEHLDIAGTEQVKESYRAALQEEPRAIIDEAIRAAARRAVSSRPNSAGKTWFNRWTTPLAAAATVMLTSSVIFMAVRDRPEVAPPIADMAVARDAEKIAPSEAAQDVAKAAPVIESNAADTRAYAAAPASAKQIAPLVDLNKVTPIAPQAAPASPAPKVLKEMKAEMASNLSAQDVSRKKQSGSDATAALTAEATGKLAPPPLAAANVAGASAAPLPPQARLLAKPATVAEPVMPRADISPAAPPAAATPAPTSDLIEKSPIVSQRATSFTSEKSDKIESADAWIKRMTELKRQEKNKELADEITRFRKRYPSVELPKELTETQN